MPCIAEGHSPTVRAARDVFASRQARLARMLAVVLACALSVSSARADLSGKVVVVADGDALTLLVDRQEVRVRLAGIDAPEHGQRFSQAARKSLAGLVAGRTVDVRALGHDGYGRLLGKVYAAGTDVNAEQVRRGYAWVFRRFSNDESLLALEADAKAARRGLWRDRAPVAPWIWREQLQAGRIAALGRVQ